MLVYNLNLLIVYISSFANRVFNKNVHIKLVSHIFSAIAFISMFIVSGYRYYVGTDYAVYKQLFLDTYPKMNELPSDEIGYYILNKLVYKISTDYQSIFIVTSLIILLLIFITIYRECNKYELGIYLFITLYHFYSSFNVIRQYIAIAITFYAVKYIFEHKFYKYLIAILLASSFHITAIIMIPVYFIVQIKMDTKDFIYGAIIGIVCLNAFEKVLSILIDLFPKYEQYNDSVLFTYGSIRGLVIYGIIFMVIYIYRDKLIKADIKNSVYINFIFISLLVSILTTRGVLFARIAGFFNIYAVILIPNLIDIFNKKERRLLYYSILCVGYLYCYMMLRTNQGEVLPFKFAII